MVAISTIDLTLLGIIFEKPISAYDLKKEIEYRNLNEWTRISYPSIYKKVTDLEKKGYLTSTKIKNNNFPQKQVYEITAKGISRFNELMEKYSTIEVKIPIDINTIIMNLEKIPIDDAMIYLNNIMFEIEKKIVKLSNVSRNREGIPISGKAIIEQQLDLYLYLKDWLKKLIINYDRKES